MAPRPALIESELAQFGTVKNRLQDRRQPLREQNRLLLRSDQVLPDLDQQPGQPASRDFLVQSVADEGAVIGLIVADREARVGQRLDERLRQARIAVPKDADLPRARRAPPCGSEGVYREDRRDRARFHHGLDALRDRIAVGTPIKGEAALDLLVAYPGVAGDD